MCTSVLFCCEHLAKRLMPFLDKVQCVEMLNMHCRPASGSLETGLYIFFIFL